MVAGNGVARLTANGALDSLFGNGGVATAAVGAVDVVVQSDGRIIVAGGSGAPVTFDVARLNTNGAVDVTFGTGGKASTDFGSGAFGNVSGVTLQMDGRIIVAGAVVVPNRLSGFGLARYNPNGTLDTSFGTDGKVTTGFSNLFSSPGVPTIQPDGKIVVGGYVHTGTMPITSQFAVARYLGDTPIADANQRFLNQLYLDLLGRAIDPIGQSAWGAMLSRGVSRTQVVLQIESSSEYRSRQVQDLYGFLLNRPPDPSGLGAYTASLAGGSTVEQVKASMLGSAEYFANRAGGTNSGFLTALYRDVLGRAVDPGGQMTWGGALTAGAARQTVALAVVTSVEADQVLVQAYFRRFLHRDVDNFGLTTFVSFLQHNGRDEEVIAFIVGSDEYFSRIRS